MQSQSSADLVQDSDKLVFDMLKNTEGSGHVTYKLSHAKIAESGYTFGICQHDCKTNSDALKFITHLLEKKHIQASIIKKIRDNTLLSSNELDSVNKILEGSKQAIDEFDRMRISHTLGHIEKFIQSLPKSINVRLQNYLQARLQLVDFHNQFNLEDNGKMYQFLCKEKVKLNGQSVQIDNSKNLFCELRRFIQHTKYGMENQKACKGRFERLDTFFNSMSLCIKPESEPYLQPLTWPKTSESKSRLVIPRKPVRASCLPFSPVPEAPALKPLMKRDLPNLSQKNDFFNVLPKNVSYQRFSQQYPPTIRRLPKTNQLKAIMPAHQDELLNHPLFSGLANQFELQISGHKTISSETRISGKLNYSKDRGGLLELGLLTGVLGQQLQAFISVQNCKTFSVGLSFATQVSPPLLVATTALGVSLPLINYVLSRHQATPLPFLNPNNPNSIKLSQFIKKNQHRSLNSKSTGVFHDLIEACIHETTDPDALRTLSSMRYAIKTNKANQFLKIWGDHKQSPKVFAKTVAFYEKKSNQYYQRLVHSLIGEQFDIAKQLCQKAMVSFPEQKRFEDLHKSFFNVQVANKEHLNTEDIQAQVIKVYLSFKNKDYLSTLNLADKLMTYLSHQEHVPETLRAGLNYALGCSAKALARQSLTNTDLLQISNILSKMSLSENKDYTHEIIHEIHVLKSKQMESPMQENFTENMAKLHEFELNFLKAQSHVVSQDKILFLNFLNVSLALNLFEEIKTSLDSKLEHLLSIKTQDDLEFSSLIKDFLYVLGSNSNPMSRETAIEHLKKIVMHEKAQSVNSEAQVANSEAQAKTLLYLGRILEQNSFINLKACSDYLEKGWLLDPNNLETTLEYSRVLCRQMRYSEAEKVLRTAQNENSRPELDQAIQTVHYQKLKSVVFYSGLVCKLLSYAGHEWLKHKKAEDPSFSNIYMEESLGMMDLLSAVSSHIPELVYSNAMSLKTLSVAQILVYSLQYTHKKINLEKYFSQIQPTLTFSSMFLDGVQSFLSLRNKYQLIQNWDSTQSLTDATLEITDGVAIIPSLIHRYYFQPKREKGEVPSSRLGELSENVCWVFGNDFTSLVRFVYNNREMFKDGLSYLYSLKSNPGDEKKEGESSTSNTQQAAKATGGTGIVASCINTLKEYDPGILALIGAHPYVAAATGVIIVGGGVWIYHNKNWLPNKMSEVESSLKLASSKHLQANSHLMTIRENLEDILKYYPEHEKAYKILDQIALVQDILSESYANLNMNLDHSLSSRFNSVELEYKYIIEAHFQAFIHEKIHQNGAEIQKFVENTIISQKEKKSLILEKLETLSYLYHQEYKIVSREEFSQNLPEQTKAQIQREEFSENLSEQTKVQIQISEKLLNLELVKIELDPLYIFSHDIKTRLFLEQLKPLSPKHEFLNSPKFLIISELQKSFSNQDKDVILDNLKKLDASLQESFAHMVCKVISDEHSEIRNKIRDLEQKFSLFKSKEIQEFNLKYESLTKYVYEIYHFLSNNQPSYLVYALLASVQLNQRLESLKIIDELRSHMGKNDPPNVQKDLSEIETVPDPLEQQSQKGKNDPSIVQKDLSEIKTALYLLEQQSQGCYVQESIKTLKIFSKYDDTPHQKALSAHYHARLLDLVNYLVRDEVFEQFQQAFKLEPAWVENTTMYANEYCQQADYGYAKFIIEEGQRALSQITPDSPSATVIEEGQRALSQITPDSAGVTAQYQTLEQFKLSIDERQANFTSLVCDLIFELPKSILNQRSETPAIRALKKSLGYTNLSIKFASQVSQYQRMLPNVSHYKLNLSRLSLISSGLNIVCDGMDILQGYPFSLPLINLSFNQQLGKDCFQTAVGSLNKIPRYADISFSMSFGMNVLSLATEPAKLLKKYYLEPLRKRGAPPMSYSGICVQEIVNVLNSSIVSWPLYFFSNRNAIRDLLGWFSAKCLPRRFLQALESGIKFSVKTKNTFMMTNQESSIGLFIAASAAVGAGFGLYHYLNRRWRENVFIHCQANINLHHQDEDTFNSINSALNQVLAYYPKDIYAKSLKNTIFALQKSRNTDLNLEQRLGYLIEAAKEDEFNKPVLCLTILREIDQSFRDPDLAIADKKCLAGFGLNLSNQLLDLNLSDEYQVKTLRYKINLQIVLNDEQGFRNSKTQLASLVQTSASSQRFFATDESTRLFRPKNVVPHQKLMLIKRAGPLESPHFYFSKNKAPQKS